MRTDWCGRCGSPTPHREHKSSDDCIMALRDKLEEVEEEIESLLSRIKIVEGEIE